MRDRSGPTAPGLRPLSEGYEGAPSEGGPYEGLGAWDEFRESGIDRAQALRKSLAVLGINVMQKES